MLVTAAGSENLTAAAPKTRGRRRGGLPALTARPDLPTSRSSAPGPVGATLALSLADGDLDVVVLDARARRRDAARRALARAVARRAADPRAPRRLGRARGAPGRGHADRRHRHLAGRRLRHGAPRRRGAGRCRRWATSSATARCSTRSTRRSRARGIGVRHGVAAAAVGGTPAYAAIDARRGRRTPITARLAAVADGTGAAVPGIERQRRRLRAGRADRQGLARGRPHGGLAYERFTPRGRSRCCRRAITTASSGRLTPRPRRGAAGAATTRRSCAELERHFGTRTGRLHARGRPAQLSAGAGVRARRPSARAAWCSATPRRRCTRSPGRASTSACATPPISRAGAARDAARATSARRRCSRRYAARRRTDRWAGIAFTHGLVGVFGNDLPLLRWPRGLALTLLDTLPVAKRAFTRAMMFGLR